MTASATAFNTYELLEHILLHLPIKEILLAECVCKTWQSLINKSPSISFALFRKTKELDIVGKRVYSSNGAPASVEWSDTATGVASPTPVLNPFINSLFMGDNGHQKLSSAFLFRYQIDSPKRSFYYEHASWRRMLPRQPMQKVFSAGCMRPGAGLNTIREDGTPVTLGQLSELLKGHVSRCRQCDGYEPFHVTGLAYATRSGDATIFGWEVLEMVGF